MKNGTEATRQESFGDARLVIYFHEHWYRVFRGQEAWLSPPFFYPTKDVLGYSVTVFLQSLPYSLFRLAGCDPYIAYEAALLIFSFLGYTYSLVLLRRLGVNRLFAIIGAVLFTFSNLFHIWIVAPQVYTVMLVPLLLVMIVKGIDNRTSRPGYSVLYLALSGTLFSLIYGPTFIPAGSLRSLHCSPFWSPRPCTTANWPKRFGPSGHTEP